MEGSATRGAMLHALALSTLVVPAHATPSLPEDPTACFQTVASALADDAMEGRGLGTPGLARAADLLSAHMKALGLKPGARAYKQPFEALTGVSLGARNTLDDGAARGLGVDWTPAGFSASGTVDAPLVFAGYGITATDLGYDDYAGLDVKGKAVLALRYEPGEDDPDSVFDGKKASRHSDLRAKAIRAREKGAAALILVSPAKLPDEPDRLPPLKVEGPLSDAGLPVIFVTRAVADAWLAAGAAPGGAPPTVASLRAAIDAAKKPVAAALTTRVRAEVTVTPTTATSWNLVGVIPGRGALKDEVVVLGAHYDHLGRGGAGSLRPGVDAIHNGADDNASGVAGAMCAAADLARGKAGGDRRTVALVGFSAEETGLGGSAAFLRDPALAKLGAPVAMVNLDMVGRVREGVLNALGTDSSPAWQARIAEAAKVTPELKVQAGGDGYGPSDHASFYAAGVPVVHLFSGAHPEYHTPDDDLATLNTAGGGSVVRFTAALVDALARGPEKLAYARSAGNGAPGGDSRGYGAYFGSVPDYSAMEGARGGVKISDTRPGSPAERAGLKKDDVIVRMAGTSVGNLQDMTYVLQEHRPGESIEVVVKRGNDTLTLVATLGTRSERSGGGSPHGGGAPAAVSHGASQGAEGASAPSATPPPAAPFPAVVQRPAEDANALLRPEETHLRNLRRLTFGGDNAEAYWSPDGKRLILQITPKSGGCDQEYIYEIATSTLRRVSSGKGRTTCGYFDAPKGTSFLYATTEGASEACPAPPDRSQGYVWPIYDTFDIVRDDGTGKLTPWNAHPGYDAEATTCPVDGRVVFTSTRNGDLDLYVANADGSGLRQVTNTPGYDGGAFFTQDCKRILWRASRPTGEALADYQRLLGQQLVRPSALDLFLMDIDGTNVRQLTFDGKGRFAPYMHPDNTRLLYVSNKGDPKGRDFDIYMVKVDGSGEERITTNPSFDGFPMFSPDGKKLVFSSNRANGKPGDTNVFITN